MTFYLGLLVFLLGAVIGSFLNVCVYRIPRGKSIVYPPSACPNCGGNLGPLELVPVISFIALRAKCRRCSARISWMYPLVELFTASAFLTFYLFAGVSILFLKLSIFFCILLVVSLIDLNDQIIPNKLSIPGAIIGLILSYNHIADALIGALVGYLVIALIITVSKGGMGWGDAKLLAMIGSFWGWQSVIYSLFIGSLFGSIVGIAMIALRMMDRKTKIPFGPYLAIGAMLSLSVVLNLLPFKL